MIYAKIFLDKNEKTNDKFIVVETSTKNVNEEYCILAGEHVDEYGNKYHIISTRILSAKNVAISNEAREELEMLLSFYNENQERGTFINDFGFIEYRNGAGHIDGEFDFKPDEGTPNKKIFNTNSKIIIDYGKHNLSIMNFMQVYDNEALKNLDITEPVDEKQCELLANKKI